MLEEEFKKKLYLELLKESVEDGEALDSTFCQRLISRGSLTEQEVQEAVRNAKKQGADDFLDGVYAVPRSPEEPRVKVRALHDYCQSKGIEPKDLSSTEIQRFLVCATKNKS